MAIGKRMSLNEARFHILDPADRKENSIQGFAVETGEEGGIRSFKVTEAAKGLAARQGFTDQIGLITAAFYEPMGDPGARSRGANATDLGTFRKLTIKERDDVKIGKPIAVVHIRYVDPEELKNLGR